MLIVSSIIGGTTLAIVLWLSARTSARHLREIETSIEEGITSKGKVLTENHALALRGMVLDNAFLDMQTLVARAVSGDPDLVYGLFVNSDGEALAFERRDKTDAQDKDTGKDAWRALGLADADLVARQESVRRLRRLNEEVVEVAVPVVGEDHELLGTIRYGLSTRRMHQAIVAADADSKAEQLRSVALIGAAVGLATVLGILLGRVQAVRITRPVQALTRAAGDLAGGDRSVRVTIESGDELQMLGYSFNRMVEDLSSSYDELEQLNRTLEQKVEARTLELAGRNRDMRLVLDNVDQGFITLSPDGTMASEHSAVVDRWFGQYTSAQTFWQYLAPTSSSFAAGFEQAWEQLAADVLPCEVAVEQLPSQLTVNRSTFGFRYLPFLRDEKLEGVLVVIADITDKLQREREEAELGELMQGFRRMTLDRSGFSAFLSEASSMVELIASPATEPSVLNTALHTLKGNAGQMGLSVVARLCHQLEEELVTGDRMSAESLAHLSDRWQALTDQMAQLIRPGEHNAIEVTDDDYTALISLLSRSTDGEALNQVLSWQLEPAFRSLGRLAEQAQALGKRLGKGELEVTVEPTLLRLDQSVFGPFFSDLGHVVRNAVDHGIEPAEQRRAAGKPARGRIAFSVRARERSVTFEISDDGAGIDWESVRKKGKALGLPGETPAELLTLLCQQGVTTRSEVTQTSGRGVGMSAVKQRVEAMRGTIEVQSSRGVGTKWTIVLPWAPEQATARLRAFEQASPGSRRAHGRAGA
ncbi:MAG TPA: ATP-binding protein [Polyangiaceae bacterium]|nr:ATP-binding protein [Polyangiaceae bacterium]